MDGSTKIRIKAGAVEVDCEGTETFLKDELPKLIETIVKLHPIVPAKDSRTPGEDSRGDERTMGGAHGTTGSIAAVLKSKSGSEVALAAGACLLLAKKKETFKRNEILDEMQTANGYYKQSFRKNLSKYLKTLVTEGKFTEVSSDTYAMTPSARSAVEKQIGPGS